VKTLNGPTNRKIVGKLSEKRAKSASELQGRKKEEKNSLIKKRRGKPGLKRECACGVR